MRASIPGSENRLLVAPGAEEQKRQVVSWGWGDALVASGCIACIVAAIFLPWAKAAITWKSVFTQADIDLGVYSYSLLDMSWLAALVIAVAVFCLAGLVWRKRAAIIALSAFLLLVAGSVIYLVSLIGDAYDFLGFVDKALELVRALPFIGPVVESVIRERLFFSAWPQAGLFLFMASTILILIGGLLIRRRGNLDRLEQTALPTPG